MHSHLVQFRSCAKDMTITIVIMNLQTENGAGVWMTSCPEEMVLRIWGLWKRVSWDWTIEARVGYSAVGSWILTIEDIVGFFGSLPTEILNITRCATCWNGQQRLLRIVSLFLCHHGPKSGINKHVHIWNNRIRLYVVFVLWLWLISLWLWLWYKTKWERNMIIHYKDIIIV